MPGTKTTRLHASGLKSKVIACGLQRGSAEATSPAGLMIRRHSQLKRSSDHSLEVRCASKPDHGLGMLARVLAASVTSAWFSHLESGGWRFSCSEQPPKHGGCNLQNIQEHAVTLKYHRPSVADACTGTQPSSTRTASAV